jgi:hypothetical protein
VCGDCPHRHFVGGSCYVPTYQAPLSVWRAWWRGNYDGDDAIRKVRVAMASGAGVRLGSYGDPAAVPVAVWDAFLAKATSRSGYTHQWRLPQAQALRGLCMASCDTEQDVTEAVALGWRYFRVLAPGEVPPPRSIECLATARDLTCAECRICNGARLDRTVQPASVWIRVHGALAKRFVSTTVEIARGRRPAALRLAA